MSRAGRRAEGAPHHTQPDPRSGGLEVFRDAHTHTYTLTTTTIVAAATMIPRTFRRYASCRPWVGSNGSLYGVDSTRGLCARAAAISPARAHSYSTRTPSARDKDRREDSYYELSPRETRAVKQRLAEEAGLASHATAHTETRSEKVPQEIQNEDGSVEHPSGFTPPSPQQPEMSGVKKLYKPAIELAGSGEPPQGGAAT
ncbi:hypothetical protein DFH11DRAFT_1878691 [Phellopilus nigrolimitatus]|nr:hypothetical protein DFH11DRAFT_1878691 [Phellopilus nigrolimitatus]